MIKIIICSLLISGCSTVVPVKQKFPTPPEMLMKEPKDLNTIGQTKVPNTSRDINEGTSDVKLSDVAITVSKNYGTYYQVVEQLKSLQEWIRKQKELSDG
jgi:uncharacterized protein YceK